MMECADGDTGGVVGLGDCEGLTAHGSVVGGTWSRDCEGVR